MSIDTGIQRGPFSRLAGTLLRSLATEQASKCKSHRKKTRVDPRLEKRLPLFQRPAHAARPSASREGRAPVNNGDPQEQSGRVHAKSIDCDDVCACFDMLGLLATLRFSFQEEVATSRPTQIKENTFWKNNRARSRLVSGAVRLQKRLNYCTEFHNEAVEAKNCRRAAWTGRGFKTRLRHAQILYRRYLLWCTTALAHRSGCPRHHASTRQRCSR